MKTKRYHITDIKWDYGDYADEPDFTPPDLPKDFNFKIEVDPDFPEDFEDILINEITEHFGWLIEEIEYEEMC